MASDLTERLSITHPQYDLHINDWTRWLEAYQGTGGYLNGSRLIQHPREDSSVYDYRKKLARFENYSKQIVEDWVSRLFGPGLVLSLDNPDKTSPSKIRNAATEYERNFDLLGNNSVGFFRQWAKEALTLGCAGVFVQVANRSAKRPSTLLEAETCLRPYARIVRPQHIRNFEWDRYGILKWVLLAEPITEEVAFSKLSTENQSGSYAYTGLNARYTAGYPTPVDGFAFHMEGPDTGLFRYYYMDKDVIRIFDPKPDGSEEYTARKPIEHRQGRIPFQMLYWTPPEPRQMFVRPVIEDVYGFQDLIYQMSSGMTEIMTNQMFGIMVMAQQGASRRHAGDEDAEHIIGTSQGLYAPAGAGFPPFWLSPDTDLPRVHKEIIDDLRKSIVRISKAGPNALVDDGRVRDASGRAKAFEADRLTAFLRDSGDILEPSCKELISLYWSRSVYATEKVDSIVKFPDTFLLRGAREEAEETLALSNALQESPSAQKVLKRQLVRSALRSYATDTELTEIIEEIESTDYKEFMGDTLNSPMPDQQDGLIEEGNDAPNNQSESGERDPNEQPGRDLKRS